MDKPHDLRYRRRDKGHREDQGDLNKMIEEGLVEIVEKGTKYITYRYKC